jgi:hypothetical protein
MDECVFSHKSYQKLAWAEKHTNIIQSQSLGSQPCVAVMAAVSIDKGLILFHKRPKSFNAKSFCDFLEDLRDSLGHDRPAKIMLDNCRIHKAGDSYVYAYRYNFELLFNQPYCPWYNGCEYVWSIAKHRFKAL